VTETQEQTRSAETSAQGRSAATGAGGEAARPAAKRGSLSSMLLPELQQVAAGLGLPTAKMKKSDLIAAIQAARSANGAPPAAAERVQRGERAQRAERGDAAPEQREQHSAPRADQTPVNGSRGEQPPAAEQDAERPQGGERQQGGQNRNRNQNRNQHNGQGAPNQQGGQQGERQGGQQGERQGGQQGERQGGQQARDEDSEEYGARRGRRYRDRRGRSRDRGRDGAAPGEAEPTISEDDVLTPVAGVLDTVEDKNTWFIRTGGYYASPDDVYVANSYVRKYNLRRGDAVTGAVRQPREGERREKYNPLVRLDTVNGKDPEEMRNRVEFTKLTPLYPQERLRLETEPHILTTRVIDLVMPIGKGQRALIVSPPKAGKTSVLQAIANAIATNNPEVHLMVVLVDERPEEVTDMQRSVKGEVIASTFDRRPQDHTMVAELSIERAKRLVELGHDVVVLLDSITRLGRAYNLAAPASGRILSGGVDSTALYPPKRFLGAARNIENGGSLTILATALVETGSAGDTVIFEEFKGTGNAELRLKREIADKRVFPAVDVDQSSTRKEEILLSPDELAVTIKLRRVLHALEPQQAIDLLLDRLRKTRTNLEFLMQIAKTAPGQE
jgi:transcription termination factor Rho